MKPLGGRSSPDGGENLKDPPDGRGIESVIGFNYSLPENAMAVTTVGEAKKFIVWLFPSLRDLKLLKATQYKRSDLQLGTDRLKEVNMAVGDECKEDTGTESNLHTIFFSLLIATFPLGDA